MTLLLDDALFPITSYIGFVEGDCARVAEEYSDWQRPLWDRQGKPFVQRELAGDLQTVLAALLPLSDSYRRTLFVPTRGQWTAVFGNRVEGTDVATPIGVLARRLGDRAVRIGAVPNTRRRREGRTIGRFGASIFEVIDPAQAAGPLHYLRALGAGNDGERWVWNATGTVLPFEAVEQYAAPRIRDRLPFDLLERYARALGIEAFDEGFYMPDGRPAVLFEGKEVDQDLPGLSLDEAQRRWEG